MFNFKKPVCESPYHCTVISVSLANMSFLDAGEKHYKCIFVDEGGFKLLNKGRSEFHWPVSNHRSTVGLVSSCITEDGGVGWNFFIGIECRIPWQLFSYWHDLSFWGTMSGSVMLSWGRPAFRSIHIWSNWWFHCNFHTVKSLPVGSNWTFQQASSGPGDTCLKPLI